MGTVIPFAAHSRRAHDRDLAARQADALLAPLPSIFEPARFGLAVALSIVTAALLPFALWRHP